MTYVLKRDTVVSPDPSRDDYQPGQLITLERDTPLDDIVASELEQLAPEHFADDAGSDDLPADWRTNEDTLAHDRRQAAATAAEAKARAKAKAAKNKAGSSS